MWRNRYREGGRHRGEDTRESTAMLQAGDVVIWTRVAVLGVGRSGQIPRDLGGNGVDLEMDWLWRTGR